MIDVIETLLIARGIRVSELADHRIRHRFDTDDLDEWVYRALTAPTIRKFLESAPGGSQRYRPEMAKTSVWLQRGQVKVLDTRYWRRLVRRDRARVPWSMPLRGRGYLVLPAREVENEFL